MTTTHPIRLEGRRVVLREFNNDDTAALAAIVGDDKVTYWLSFDQRSEDETHAMLAGIMGRASHEHRDEYYLAVTTHTDDAVVGLCRLGLGGVHAAKLGFAINADHWGRGLASDAAATMVNYGFTSLGLHRITAAIGPENKASVAIVTKLGFAYEGRLRDHVYTNSAWRDSLLYALLGPS